MYCHKDSTNGKASNYVRFVDLFGDGVFWAAQFELLVDPGKAVKLKKGTDQWAYPSEAVKITALWICARTSAQMVDGDAVSIVGWNPLLEVNPHAPRGSGQRFHSLCTHLPLCAPLYLVGPRDLHLYLALHQVGPRIRRRQSAGLPRVARVNGRSKHLEFQLINHEFGVLQ